MGGGDPPGVKRRRAALGLLLTALAGFVDAFGYLTLSHVYTANMSGNTVLIAVGLFGHADRPGLHAFTVGAFLAGLIGAGAAMRLGLRLGWRRLLAIAMTAEAVCLGLLAALAPEAEALHETWLVVAVAATAIAMGIQNTSLRTAGILDTRTTHVTGALAKFGEGLVEIAFRQGREGLYSGAVWLCFFAGAAAAGFAGPLWGRPVLVPVIAILIAVAIADFWRAFGEIENPPPK